MNFIGYFFWILEIHRLNLQSNPKSIIVGNTNDIKPFVNMALRDSIAYTNWEN